MKFRILLDASTLNFDHEIDTFRDVIKPIQAKLDMFEPRTLNLYEFKIGSSSIQASNHTRIQAQPLFFSRGWNSA
jgi:hypothetical protein